MVLVQEEQFHEDLISMVLSGMVDDPDQNPSYTPSQCAAQPTIAVACASQRRDGSISVTRRGTELITLGEKPTLLLLASKLLLLLLYN
eukprot:5670766-Amphidinium_carterae.2